MNKHEYKLLSKKLEDKEPATPLHWSKNSSEFKRNIQLEISPLGDKHISSKKVRTCISHWFRCYGEKFTVHETLGFRMGCIRGRSLTQLLTHIVKAKIMGHLVRFYFVLQRNIHHDGNTRFYMPISSISWGVELSVCFPVHSWIFPCFLNKFSNGSVAADRILTATYVVTQTTVIVSWNPRLF